MSRNFVIPQSLSGCLEDIIFMQNSNQSLFFIGITSLLTWYLSPRFWYWGFLKDNIDRQKPASVPDLKDNFHNSILDIPADSLWSALKSMILQLQNIFDRDTKNSFSATLLLNIDNSHIKYYLCIIAPFVDGLLCNAFIQ